MEHPLVGRSRVRSSARASPFQCINLSRPSLSSILRFPQSDAHSLIHSPSVHSFAHCSLIAQKSIQGNVQKCHKEEEKRKEEKEVHLEPERRRKERTNVCPIGIH